MRKTVGFAVFQAAIAKGIVLDTVPPSPYMDPTLLWGGIPCID